MSVNKIFIKFNDANITLPCLKISSQHFKKINETNIKSGAIIYSSKNSKLSSSNRVKLFVSESFKIVEQLNSSKFIIEVNKDIAKNIKFGDTVKIFAMKEEISDKTIVETKEHELIENNEEKEELIEETTENEDLKLDKTLDSVLESIKAKIDSEKQLKEEKKKEATEVEKLRLELMKKKLELINEWIKANKKEEE